MHDQLPDLGMKPFDLALAVDIATTTGAGLEGPRRLVLKLLLTSWIPAYFARLSMTVPSLLVRGKTVLIADVTERGKCLFA